MKFKSDLYLVKDLSSILNGHTFDFSKLPQIYRGDVEFVKQQQNDILNVILSHLPPNPFKYASVDTRSHMLMKGMYPCIPGWHCDDFYRSPTTNQPDLGYHEHKLKMIHYMVILGENSSTTFLEQDIELPYPDQFDISKPIYYSYNKLLELMNISTVQVEPYKLYYFGPLAFHKGEPSTHNGWRYFFRVTYSNVREPKNELRYQTQVYLKDDMGW